MNTEGDIVNSVSPADSVLHAKKVVFDIIELEFYRIEFTSVILSNHYRHLVAGVGFEPTTFRLCP